MRLTLRSRIFLTLVPLLALLGVLGAAGVVLLYRLGGSIDLILRENYASVIAMERLNEAVERIDSSFQFALAGEEAKAQKQYQESWPAFEANLQVEESNITIHPREDELVAGLREWTRRYRSQGNQFYAHAPNAAERHQHFVHDLLRRWSARQPPGFAEGGRDSRGEERNDLQCHSDR